MVLNSAWVGTVARVSAEAWQYVACNPERLSGDQVLDLLCCLPLHHLRRLALALFSFFCFPITPDHRRRVYYFRNLSDSDDDDDSDSDSDSSSHGYDSHSD